MNTRRHTLPCPCAPRPWPTAKRAAKTLTPVVCAVLSLGASAQALNGLGVGGGLAVPDARGLGTGTIALGMSNAPEPQFGKQPSPRSYLLGIGVLPGLEISGRFAEYATRQDGVGISGISDLSFNLKYSLAWSDREDDLRVAVGANDYGGQATNFRGVYAVATLPMGPLQATLGAGRSEGSSSVPGTKRALDGAFGALALQLPLPAASGTWTLAAEHDARQPLAGVRWESPALPALAHSRFSAAVHRTFESGALNPAATVWMVGLTMPFGHHETLRERVEGPAPQAEGTETLTAAQRTASALLATLKARLVALGLEHVRVGRLDDGTWVVAYQNRRFGANELDALGVVTGLAADAAQHASAEVPALTVVVHKQRQPVLTLHTEPALWRGYLQHGLAGPARGATRLQRGAALDEAAVDWVVEPASAGTRLQLRLAPEFNYTMGTEVGSFDYSLAASARATMPLWAGGTLLASTRARLHNTRNMEPGRDYQTLRHDEGLQALALHQTWWWGQRAVLGAAIGRFEYDAWGVEAEAQVFVPGRDDVVLLRGRALEHTPAMPNPYGASGAVIYRWVMQHDTWVEAGVQRYLSESAGPSLGITRWWGDVGVQLFYRRDARWQFAGVEFVLPLTPRAGAAASTVQVEGHPSFRQGIRTMVRNPANYVIPRAVREGRLVYALDTEALNAGRLGPEQVLWSLPRMRQAYLTYVQPRTGP